MAQQKIDVSRLSKEELIYEISIRTAVECTDKTVKDLCKILKAALDNKDILDASIPAYPYSFKDDSAALVIAVADLRDLINEYSVDERDSSYRKIKTKLTHALGRLGRSVATTAGEERARGTLNADLLLLSAEFKTKGKKIKKSNESLLELSMVRQNLRDGNLEGSELDESSSDSEVEVTMSKVRPRPLPVRDWGVKFSGKRSGESLSAFLEQVEDMRIPRGISRVDLFNSAMDLFTGDARVWFRAMRSRLDDWDGLVEALREEYLPPRYDQKLFDEIKKRTQGKGESIGMYMAVMQNMFARLQIDIPESTKLEIMTQNIAPYYQQQLTFTDIGSVKKLQECCKKIDATRELVDSYVPPPHKNQCLEPDLAFVGSALPGKIAGVGSAGKTSSCWNCGGPGHYSRDCRAGPKEVRCPRCNRMKVAGNCPNCNNVNYTRRVTEVNDAGGANINTRAGRGAYRASIRRLGNGSDRV